MSGDSTGSGYDFHEGSSGSSRQGRDLSLDYLMLNPKQLDRVIALPLFRHHTRIMDVHPFLRLLAWFSHSFNEEALEHAESTRTVYMKPRKGFDSATPARETFNPTIHPSAKFLEKPLIIPEELREEFLATIKGYSTTDLTHNPFVEDKRVMDYAIGDQNDRIGNKDFADFVTAIRDKESPLKNKNIYPSLCKLLEIFPFCDFRLELAYLAYNYLNNPKQKKDDPPYECSLNPEFLDWASQKNNSQNIALRFLHNIRVINGYHYKKENPTAPNKGILAKTFSIFSSKSKNRKVKPQSSLYDNDAPYVDIEIHRDLLNGVRVEKIQWIKEFYQESFLKKYKNIVSGRFFGEKYCSAYRIAKDAQVSFQSVELFDFNHPFYDTKSQDPNDIKMALFYSVAHDFYTFRNFGKFNILYLDDNAITRIDPFFFSTEQVKNFREWYRRMGKIDIQPYNDMTALSEINKEPADKREDALFKLTKDTYVEPRACALYRIFMMPESCTFEEKMLAMGLPLSAKDPETLSEMKKLIQWLNTGSNVHIVGDIYLITQIKQFMDGMSSDDCKKIVNTLIQLDGEEKKALETCPEILLVAALSPKYHDFFTKKGFRSLSAFPFHLYAKELEEFRFGSKRIEKRAEFIADLPKIMERYRYLSSRKWTEDLTKQMDAYTAPEPILINPPRKGLAFGY